MTAFCEFASSCSQVQCSMRILNGAWIRKNIQAVELLKFLRMNGSVGYEDGLVEANEI